MTKHSRAPLFSEEEARTTGAAIFMGATTRTIATEYGLRVDDVHDILAAMVAMKIEVESPAAHEQPGDGPQS